MKVSNKETDYIFNKKKYEMDNIRQLFASCASVSGFIGSVLLVYLPSDTFINKKLGKISEGLNVKQEVKKGINMSGLSFTGFRLLDIKCTENENLIINGSAIEESLPKKEIAAIKKNTFAWEAATGKKSNYLYKENTVFINLEKLGATAFHKIGHAIFYYQNKYGHLARKIYVSSFLAIFAFSLTALLKKPQDNGNKSNSKTLTDKIKNNVTKLVALSFIPILLNEMMANHKGLKLAEKVCSKEVLKKVKLANKWEFLSYLMGAIITTSSIYLANKIRNHLGRRKN